MSTPNEEKRRAMQSNWRTEGGSSNPGSSSRSRSVWTQSPHHKTDTYSKTFVGYNDEVPKAYTVQSWWHDSGSDSKNASRQ